MSPVISVKKDALDIKPSATTATLTVHPEGLQDGEKQDTGPGQLQ